MRYGLQNTPIKPITIVGMPTPSPTPIAILSDRLRPPPGVSPFSSFAADVGCVSKSVALVLDVGVEPVSVLVLGREVVVAVDREYAQVSAEVQYVPSGQQ
jgi:hypothetical protein